MDKYIMMIHNLTNDSKYIYKLKECYKRSFRDTFNEIYNSLKVSNTSIDLTIFDDRCEIFEDTNYIKRGWVWNTNSTKRKLLFIITPLPILYTEGSDDFCGLIKPKKILNTIEQCNNNNLKQIMTIELKDILNKPNFGLKHTV
jgi:hypothetical protein